jgi:pimeloyl-ACP methyl ester carboxylesterase
MSTRYLEVPGGRLAYDEYGTADVKSPRPLVVCAPGMGDLRGEYRFLAPQLADAGYHVVAFDVRGHGESSVGWDDYSVAAVGADMLAFVRALGPSPAYLVGNSMAGGAAVWAAAEAPELVAGLVLLDPVVHDGGGSLQLTNLLLGTLFARPWGPAVWMRYFASLYPTSRPADFQDYVRRLGASLREPARFAALRRMLFASKAAAAERIAKVTAPTLIVMGTRDRDFKDPAAEARFVATSLTHATTKIQLIPGAGHYPHAEMPGQAGPEVVSFLQNLREDEEVAHGR